MGEHQTASGSPPPSPLQADAAAGWGGDRITLLGGPDRGLGDRLADGLGYRSGCGRVRAADGAAQKAVVARVRHRVRRRDDADGSSSAGRPALVHVANVLDWVIGAPRPAGCRLHRLGRRDPEQPQRSGQGELGRATGAAGR